ncbi:ABC transporter substrate-binding protein [Nocardioides yefusunii]|uniref:ABC transporter substrate-binding protein n=1 Tax=Nocardioides yefusunii TaxID=2500546 RepID=A0ABW1R0E4_9ACTN|nr:ABC transporter substrate-binding protein [Nocardioides yefusunii]
MRTRRTVALATLPFLLALGACGVEESEPGDGNTVTADDAKTCAESAVLAEDGADLVIATDSPAFEPWFVDDDPTNAKGFESAVAYEVAERLGFDDDAVSWTTVPFDNIYAPGTKKFDFAINQVSISADRAKAVDFSTGYYSAAQAAIVLKDGAVQVKSLGDLTDLKIGAQTGTTSLTAIREVIKPKAKEMVFETTNAAKQALLNGQVDAIIADLPTAFYITAVEIPEAELVGQFQPDTADQEKFGLVLGKGSKLTPCVNAALEEMIADGSLADIENEWLSQVVGVPALD